MSATFNQLYVHLVWATWDRLPLLTPLVREAVFRCIEQKCADLRCSVLAIGGVEDHIHVLVHLNASVAVAALVKEMKGASSHLVAHSVTPDAFFRWQGHYGVFSVEQDSLPRIIQYIQNQEQHHRAGDLGEQELPVD